MPKGKKYGGLQAAPPRFKNCENCGEQYSDYQRTKAGKTYRLMGKNWSERRFCRHACRILPGQEPQWKICVACGKNYSNIRKLNGRGQSGSVTPEKWAVSRWCSTQCRWVTQAAKVVEKICLGCGKTFNNRIGGSAPRSSSFCNSVRFSQQKYCSNPCGLRHRQHRTSMQAFHDNIGKKRKNGCIYWLGHRTAFGHGRIELKDINGRGILAHRLSYALFRGPVPGDRIVCHDCGNAPCVNPAHLYLGDYMTNAADRFGKTRPNAKDIKNRHPGVYVNAQGKLCIDR